MKIDIHRLALVAASLTLAACASIPSPESRRNTADGLAVSHGWHSIHLNVAGLSLVAYMPDRETQAERLTVYIEGDGLAWISSDTPSADPTPVDPVALKLALAQPAGDAAYLGRPCQYVDAEATGCPMRYWTDARFSDRVVDASDAAISRLKARFGASHLTLVGYSGGGAVAALVAARRTDVDRLVTVAGNLDPRAWTALHRVSPLAASLDPVDEVDRLERVAQWHFVGADDRNLPPRLAEGYAARFPAGQRPRVIVVPGFDHHCCWARDWPNLWSGIQPPSAAGADQGG